MKKRTPKLWFLAAASCVLLGGIDRVKSQVTVTVDPTQNWVGYMNVYELPANGGGFDFGNGWATADLDATFSGSTLTLTPNDNIDRTDPIDSYWWQAPNDGSLASLGNHTMDASMYVQNDSLAGQTITFSGNIQANTLVSPYTSTIFIKDFAPDYSSSTEASAPVVAGAFSITKATSAGDHIQYGFETVGPNARTAALPSLGSAIITAALPPGPLPVVVNEVQNGGFETSGSTSTGAADWLGAGGGGAISTETLDSSNPHSGSYDLQLEGQGSGTAGPSAIALQSGIPIPVDGPISLQFYADGVLMDGGANPQYMVQWFNASGGVISTVNASFPTALTSSYQLENVNLTAPAGAVTAQLQFNLAVGAGTTDHYIVDIDDVALGYTNNPSVNVTVDPSQTWSGYMAWSPVPTDPGGDGGSSSSPWNFSQLDATFFGNLLSFTPNDSIFTTGDPLTDTYWWNPDGTGANEMDASGFVASTALAGTTLTFSGYYSNSLAQPYSNSVTAFIKCWYDQAYQNFDTAVTTNLYGHGQFSVTVLVPAGGVCQYGFEMVGPNVTNAAAYGYLLAASNAAAIKPPVIQYPTNNAPTPTWSSGADVLAIYESSDTAADMASSGFPATWSGSAQNPFTIHATGSQVLYLPGLTFVGDTYNGINTTGLNTMHVDVWTPNANQLFIQLVSLDNGGTQAAQVETTSFTPGQWSGIDIPLSQFTAASPQLDLTDIQQILWVDNVGAGLQGADFYLDNIYFYNRPNAVAASASLNGATRKITFATQAGFNYTVQYTTSLSSPVVWQSLSSVSGNGSAQMVSDTSTGNRFYRVIAQ